MCSPSRLASPTSMGEERMMFKIAAMLGALVLGATALSGPAVAENPVPPKVQLQAVAAAFPTGWGSLTKASLTKANGVNPNPFAPLVSVRTGRHACSDRVVFHLRGAGKGGDPRCLRRHRC